MTSTAFRVSPFPLICALLYASASAHAAAAPGGGAVGDSSAAPSEVHDWGLTAGRGGRVVSI